MKRKILFVIPCNNSLGSFLTETFRPYFIFIKNKYSVDFAVSQEQSLSRISRTNDLLDISFLNGGYYKKTFSLEEINVENYSAVYIPGGLAHMINNRKLQNFLLNMYEKGVVIGLICNGPICLLNIKLSNNEYLIKGKYLTCLSNQEEKDYQTDTPFFLETALIERGAKYSSAAPWKSHIVIDGKLITGQNPASGRLVAEAIISVLENK
ncbi:type 1 glutamine amidotransferase domain-containing protein [Chryseobacterium sp. ON_d1]|uniref:type 1 glutamine amidotransferase domain-containing protein n=1 Tax=Chryseobacterium sp. ON_d1 TaxID=2583211 RepID=UPI001158ADFC|nr:type 1 glutamine amidotransferase domain-containing protein [Chryseobacterium sp. ON_d1]GEJ43610.1 glutamine amidotransferase [Chryseobacterium sp. ON_d1]